jgi:hypothetical protein
MRMTEAIDLIHKHVYHVDLFSKQLHNLVEQLDEEDTSMHGVVGDAFYMSFKAYKGRIFLLGFNEVSIGALPNWADRLIAIMENGDYLGAIQLATSYFTGDADKLTVGLPEDTNTRHTMVRDKILEIMSASLKYVFGQRQKGEQIDDQQLTQLAETCFVACQSIENTDFVFDEMYEWYEDAEVEGIFLEALEPYILDRTVTIVPPSVIKAMVTHYVTKGWESRLEEMLCHMETATLDLDQTTLLCKQHGLYDALIYIWNKALGDYITPMIDLLTLLRPYMAHGGTRHGNGLDDFDINAVKLFPYLSYTLTGRVYPNEELMDEETAVKAKAEIYWFLFSGQTITWPKEGGQPFITRPDDESEPAFPYLRLILKFDAPSFLSSLNEAFEDSFLNDSPEKGNSGISNIDMPEEQIFGQTINRQYVVSILLDVMNPSDFPPEDTIYLDMFIARNLPKFPQYLLFTGSTLSRVLTGLCNYPGEDLADDAQLSAEYLLSVYHPSDMAPLMPLLREARFFRILKRIYKVDKHYGKLIATYFEDQEDQEGVFECIADCLRPQSGLNDHQVREVIEVVKEHARDLLELGPELAASTLRSQGHDVHQAIIDSAEDEKELQHAYLKELLEPSRARDELQQQPQRELIEQYIQLMCSYEPSHVSDYIGMIQSANLRLDRLLPTMEETGVIDAAVVLMAQDGQVKEAMNRLVRHLESLESAFLGLVSGSSETDVLNPQHAAEELLQSLQNYVHVGIWLCQGQMKTSRKATVVQKKKKSADQEMSADEALWLILIQTCVHITRRLSPAIATFSSYVDDVSDADSERLISLLRSLVQHTFTSLLTATSNHGAGQLGNRVLPNAGANLSFLRVLRAFLTQAAAESPNLADLRGVLASIFAAYAYEESILRLSNRLLERSLYVHVNQAVELRQRGWRPRGSTCEACGRRVWGPGVAGRAVFEAWEDKQAVEEARRKDRLARLAEHVIGDSAAEVDGKGKGKSLEIRPSSMSVDQQQQQQPPQPDGHGDVPASVKDTTLGPLVVLACRHIYHQSCLDALQEKGEHRKSGREREYKCPVDG